MYRKDGNDLRGHHKQQDNSHDASNEHAPRSQVVHLETLVRRLRANTQIDDADIAAVLSLPMHIKEVAAGSAVALEGDRPNHCCLVINGFTVRSKNTDGGRRQILSVHISGDIPDLQSLHLHVMDHDLRTLSHCTLGFIAHDSLRALTRSRPIVAEALWRETLVDAAIFREWIVNVGRRAANQRLAHFILEMRCRLELVGLGSDRTFELPMTQSDLADTLGLTPVHVNRVIKALRTDGLLDIRRFVVNLADAEALMERADFDDLYLHQSPEL
jgi:CRP-like cAMP-binding protein